MVDKIHGITFQSKRKLFEQNGRHALGCLILLHNNEDPLLRIEKARGSWVGTQKICQEQRRQNKKQRQLLACMDARIVGCRLGAALGFNSSSAFEF